jgi:hypothetical protein
MEDIRNYRIEEDEQRRDDAEYNVAPQDDEVPFHIPRD